MANRKLEKVLQLAHGKKSLESKLGPTHYTNKQKIESRSQSRKTAPALDRKHQAENRDLAARIEQGKTSDLHQKIRWKTSLVHIERIGLGCHVPKRQRQAKKEWAWPDFNWTQTKTRLAKQQDRKLQAEPRTERNEILRHRNPRVALRSSKNQKGKMNNTHEMKKRFFHLKSNKIHMIHGGHRPPSLILLETKNCS
jgi:hypothetical protein